MSQPALFPRIAATQAREPFHAELARRGLDWREGRVHSTPASWRHCRPSHEDRVHFGEVYERVFHGYKDTPGIGTEGR